MGPRIKEACTTIVGGIIGVHWTMSIANTLCYSAFVPHLSTSILSGIPRPHPRGETGDGKPAEDR